jgi:hypothetical protein
MAVTMPSRRRDDDLPVCFGLGELLLESGGVALDLGKRDLTQHGQLLKCALHLEPLALQGGLAALQGLQPARLLEMVFSVRCRRVSEIRSWARIVRSRVSASLLTSSRELCSSNSLARCFCSVSKASSRRRRSAAFCS